MRVVVVAVVVVIVVVIIISIWPGNFYVDQAGLEVIASQMCGPSIDLLLSHPVSECGAG